VFGGVALVVAGSHATGGSVYGDLLAVGNLLVFTGYFLLAKQIRGDNVHAWSLLAAIFVVTSFAACALLFTLMPTLKRLIHGRG
jgi:drug/metabolite transporter (DMT)-like permease